MKNTHLKGNRRKRTLKQYPNGWQVVVQAGLETFTNTHVHRIERATTTETACDLPTATVQANWLAGPGRAGPSALCSGGEPRFAERGGQGRGGGTCRRRRTAGRRSAQPPPPALWLGCAGRPDEQSSKENKTRAECEGRAGQRRAGQSAHDHTHTHACFVSSMVERTAHSTPGSLSLSPPPSFSHSLAGGGKANGK